MGNTSSMKRQVGDSKATPTVHISKFQNELQYDQAGAYSMVAYKNQAEDSRSDLDVAKMNFESKYKIFLTLYGQYSNAPLRQYPTKDVLSYPIGNNTQVFKHYPNLKPNK
jgi:hypothetical protein